jgi:amino acid transporter
MRRGLLLALATAAVSGLLPAGASAGTLDQQQLLASAPGPQPIFGGATPNSIAQTFTAGLTEGWTRSISS